MVNLGLNFSSLLGIVLAVAGAGLYFLRSWKPKLARDHDIFFAAIGLLCGGILLFQGWRLDPILAFGQFLLGGSAVFFAVESIRMRGLVTTKAKERAPIVDEERYVSDAYRVDAELDEIEPVDEYMPMARQIRGSREARPARSEAYPDEELRSRPSTARRSGTERSRPRSEDWEQPQVTEERTTRKRRLRPESRPSAANGDSYDDSYDNEPLEPEERPSRGRPRRSSSRPEAYERDEPASPSPQQPKRQTPPPEDSQYRYSATSRETISSDYAEYSPVDYDEDSDRSAN
ncbi:MAG: Ycf66 family protein [Microcoleaceae cyanobacterium]